MFIDEINMYFGVFAITISSLFIFSNLSFNYLLDIYYLFLINELLLLSVVMLMYKGKKENWIAILSMSVIISICVCIRK